MKRVVLWGLGSFLALLLLALFAVFLVLRSESGTAWLLEQVPGLEVSGGEGSILGRWQAQSLRWQGYGVSADLDKLYLQWSPGCLLKGVLCVDRLLAERIDIHLAPSEPTEDSEPFKLPSLDLPVGLSVGDVRLGPLSVDDSSIWQSFTLAVEASGTSWTISDFNLVTDAVEVGATGRLQTEGDWPLDLDVKLALPSPEPEKDWRLALNLGGSAYDLRVSGTSTGYLDATLSGKANPFRAGVPARLKLNSKQFEPWSGLPSTLTLKDWALALDGNLNDGFDLDTTAELPGTTGPVALSLKGNVLTDRARDIQLRARGPGNKADHPQTLALDGQVRWLDDLAASGKLTLDHFPWYGLLPDMDEPPVKLETAEVTFDYQNGIYTAHVDGTGEGPVGSTRLKVDARGDQSHVMLSGLRLTTGAGGLNGKARIDYADTLKWDADLRLDQLDPGYWVPALSGQLNGSVTSRGALPESGLDVVADWSLQGQWQNNPLDTEGHVEGTDSSWLLKPFSLQVGKNRISGQGRWSDQLEANIALQLPQLAQLWPGLAGRLNGQGQVSGTLEAPNAKLQLSGQSLGWQDIQLSSLKLNGSLEKGKKVAATLASRDIRMGEQAIGDLNLNLKGTEADHQLAIRLEHPKATVDATFTGAMGKLWSGALASARVASSGQTWTLQQAAPIAYSDDGRLTLGAHCWRWQSSSLCAEDQVLLPDQDVHYRLDNFPLDSLAALWPEGFRWQAALNGQVDLRLDAKGPEGSITLDAGPGQFGVLQQEEWRNIDYTTLKADVSLKPNDAQVSLNFGGEQLGDLTVDLNVDPSSAERRIKGTYKLSGLQLAIVEPFAGLQSISGDISGEGRLSGPLMSPRVEGSVSLSNGQLLDPSVPIPFRNVSVDVAFEGNRADISGQWQSNERSKGSLDGQVAWQGGNPTVSLVLKGSRLPLVYEPYAKLEMSPDIQFSLKDNRISVTGQVDVPRGEIEVRELPPSAVSVSDDEVVVGKEPEPSTIQEVAMDVKVVVGEDKVSFKGFGVTGNLEGELRIGNNLETRGTLKLVDGHYKAYGQELEIRRARLLFVGPISQPYIDIEAIRRVDTVVAGIRLSGPADEPEAEVFSEPPMSQSEALSYVILGRPLRSSGDQSQVGAAALSLGLSQTNELTRGIGEEFGIKDLTLEAEGSGEEASVVASGYLTEDLSVRYGVGVFEPITTVALRYDLGRYFYLEAASGLAASLDLFYTRDF